MEKKRDFFEGKAGRALLISGSLVFWLGVWTAAFFLVDSNLILPSPWAVGKRLVQLMGTGNFYASLGRSLGSILLGFLAGNLLGLVLGGLSGVSGAFRTFVKPAMTVVKATPVASFIILILVWLGKPLTPAVTSFLIVLPVVWQNVADGVAGADKNLLEVGKIYGFSLGKRIRLIYGPAAADSYLGAVRTGMGMAWKAGVAAEVLANAKQTLGGAIYDSKVYLETEDLFAWTLAVIGVSLIIETVCVALLSGGKRRKQEP